MKTRTEILESIVAWAKGSKAVEALVQTGSLARLDNSADEFSDLDIEIISKNPSHLETDASWLDSIGGLITALRLDEDQDWATCLAIFEGGVKVDFTLAGHERLADMAKSGLDPLYDRGYRVLLDKTGITKGLPAPSYRYPVHVLPTSDQFRERVEEFWFEAFHVPRYLARGELFLVKLRDWTMKELLLEMIEWHTIAHSPKPIDIWHNGTRIRQWADPHVLAELQGVFGRFDPADAARAFQATTALYGRLARDVAAVAGYEYPRDVEDKITALNAATPMPSS